MIELKYQKSSKFLWMGVVGSIMAISGFLMYTFNPLELIIKAVAVLAPNSIMFNIWTKPPYEVYVNVYIFNITNAKEFLENGEKINLEEIGPYVYQEILTNTNGHFNENGTLTFEPKRDLIFHLDKSVGDPKLDKIISTNIPLLGISSALKDSSMFVNFAVAQIANMLDSKAFLELTIQEYLWGYDDRLVELANKAIPSWINFPRFGILDRMMALDNASNIVTIKASEEVVPKADFLTEAEKEMSYTISKFNGSPGLHQWGYIDEKDGEKIETNTRCNTIEGAFEGGIFPGNLGENSTIRLYRRAFCRAVEFRYESSGMVNGLTANIYRVDQKFLARPEVNPDNECYCIKGKCPQKGLSYLTPCYYGIPVVISQPHFLNSDPALSEQIYGMKPDKEKHDSILKIHPQLGVPLEASLRIQINLEVDTKYSSKCRPFNGMTIPLFWLEMVIKEVPSQIQSIVYMLYNVLPIAQQVLMWIFMLFGSAMVAAAALFTFYLPSNHGLEDPYANRIGYSPIRIIPMTQYLNENLRISK